MWETIKNDPILKTVTIIILSVLGFGFAFNIMFGANRSGMGDMGGMGSGYSLENTLSYILAIGVKLLLIALVIAAIVAVFKFGKRILGGESDTKLFSSVKKDDSLKILTIIIAAVLVLGIVYILFGGISGYRTGVIVGNSLGITGLFVFLLKFLLFISIAGVIIGAVMYIKQNYSKEIIGKVSSLKSEGKSKVKCNKCGVEIAGDFKFCPSCGDKLKEECETCGVELRPEWKCCPGCGTEKGDRS